MSEEASEVLAKVRALHPLNKELQARGINATLTSTGNHDAAVDIVDTGIKVTCRPRADDAGRRWFYIGDDPIAPAGHHAPAADVITSRCTGETTR